jgi:condensation domain-containing protein
VSANPPLSRGAAQTGQDAARSVGTGRVAAYPLSAEQLEYMRIPGYRQHAIGITISLPHGAHADSVKAALCLVTQKHEVLRVVLVRGADGSVSQALRQLNEVLADIPTVDLREASAESVIEAVRAFHLAPMDLFGDGVIRAAIVRTRWQSFLLLTVHHIVADERTNRLLLAELERAYRASPDSSEEFFTDAMTLAEITSREHSTTRSWDPPGRLPTLPIPRPNHDTENEHEDLYAELDEQCVAALRATSRDLRVPLTVVLLARLAVAIGSTYGVDEVELSSLVLGRDNPRLLAALGQFARPIWLTLPTTGSTDDVRGAAATWWQELRGRAAKQAPFVGKLEEPSPRLDRIAAPRVQLSFSDDAPYGNAFRDVILVSRGEDLEGSELGRDRYDEHLRHLPRALRRSRAIRLSASVTRGKLVVTGFYDVRSFDGRSIASLFSAFVDELRRHSFRPR